VLHVGFLLGLFFDPEAGGNIPPKSRLTFNRLYGVTLQKIESLIIHITLLYSNVK
jgi:hypothetical protein